MLPAFPPPHGTTACTGVPLPPLPPAALSVPCFSGGKKEKNSELRRTPRIEWCCASLHKLEWCCASLLESAGHVCVCVCVWWMPDLICWQFSFLETMMLKAPAETCARNEKFEQQLELAGADGPCACGPRAHACVLGRVQVCTSAWCSLPVRMED